MTPLPESPQPNPVPPDQSDPHGIALVPTTVLLDELANRYPNFLFLLAERDGNQGPHSFERVEKCYGDPFHLIGQLLFHIELLKARAFTIRATGCAAAASDPESAIDDPPSLLLGPDSDPDIDLFPPHPL